MLLYVLAIDTVNDTFTTNPFSVSFGSAHSIVLPPV